MLRGLIAAALIAFAISLTGAASGSPILMLNGSVGPGFTISLKNTDGSAVTHLDPGSYAINVNDQGTIHNFHLSGPGVDMATDVDTTSTATWNVTLVNGTYRFQCDAHPTMMNGSFTVGTVAAPAPKLIGRVGARAISLTNAAGRRVRSLPANAYKIVVTDSSKKQNFHLTGPGVNRKTGIAAKAHATWRLRLSPGTYRYRSDRNRRLSGKFTVTSAPPLA